MGGAGDDTIIGGVGVDRIYAGAGNDTINLDVQDSVMNGGDGFDTLLAADNNLNIDLSTIDNKISNIESIDLNNGTNQMAEIKLEDVMSITDDDNILRIDGGDNDAIALNTTGDGAEWTLGNFQTTDESTGETYDVYTNDDQSVTLEVNVDVHVDES